jgi:alkylation response protein AidB-like acyl-CoA dehydrogenase
MFLLVRTSTEGKAQQGISFLLLDMKTPGLTVKPIITMSGEHEVNQCFFDDVRIPAENLVGAENQGWTVAKYLLEFERGGMYSARLRGMLRKVKAMAQAECNGAGAALSDDEAFQKKMAEAETEILAVDFTERRLISQLSTGGPVGDATASMLKLRGSELTQTLSTLALEAIGAYAAPDQRGGAWRGTQEPPIGPDYAFTVTARYLNTRAATIYGGSSEVQHNILARTALGL